MAKNVEIQPGTYDVQGVNIVFGRHADETGEEGMGTSFMQVTVPKADPSDLSEAPKGTTLFFNADGSEHSRVDHMASPPVEEVHEEDTVAV